MSREALERFLKWYNSQNNPISIMEPCKFAYLQGSRDERLELAKKISNCVTYEEIMDLIRMELDSTD